MAIGSRHYVWVEGLGRQMSTVGNLCPFISKLERCDYVQVPAVQVRLAPQLAPQHGLARPPHAMQYDVIPLETHV